MQLIEHWSKQFKLWLKKRRYDKMTKLAEEFGLTCVRLKEVGNKLYLVDNKGQYRKIA